MKLKLRCSDDGESFGFVETFKPYSYVNGAISIRAVAEAGGYFSEPFVYRGGEFVSARQIEEEMGISKYIKAKKPFYSLLGEGNVIVDMRVSYDLKSKRYLPDTSYFKLYGIVKDSLVQDGDDWFVELRRYSSSSPELDNWLQNVASRVARFGIDREKFLMSRLM